MKAVIAGGGTVGMQLANQLGSEGIDVVLIERDPERARLLSHRLDCLVITGGCNSLEVLRNASVADADYFVAVTGSDEVNMIACGLVSSEFAVSLKIARVRSIDYSTTAISGKSFLGIDRVVNPEQEAAQEIVTSVERGAMSDVFVFRNSPLQMRPITVVTGSPLVGRSLAEIGEQLNVSFLVGVMVRGRTYLIPDGTTVIQEGDQLYSIASENDFRRIFGTLGKPRRPIQKVIIVGGGKVGRLVAERLQSRAVDPENPTGRRGNGGWRRLLTGERRKLQIVEQDYEKCKELSAQFPDALVTNADISDESVFQEEQFGDADLLISTTENQELNMVTALYARSLGVKRTMVLVNNSSYVSICGQLNIDVAVSVKNAVVDTIVSTIRHGDAEVVSSVRSIAAGTIEVLELSVGRESRAVGKPLRELRLPKDTLIMSVSRANEVFVPNGESVLETDDKLVTIARHDQYERLNEIFRGVP